MVSNYLMSTPTIFFHVGTGKTGTTYLQYRVFPFLKGIHYIQRTKYRQCKPILMKEEHSRYLISREFDRQMEDEVKWFAADFPDAIPIIVFRRHDSYIASQYRRFVKNGYRGDFSSFFDLENDRGFFRKKHLHYMGMVELLEHCFSHRPLVFFYEDMRENPEAFIKKMAERMGAAINMEALNLNRKHTSYSEKQLLFMQQVGKYINLKKRVFSRYKPIDFICRMGFFALRYPVLYLGKVIPRTWVGKGPLIDPAELTRVKDAFNRDWEEIHAYYRQMQ